MKRLTIQHPYDEEDKVWAIIERDDDGKLALVQCLDSIRKDLERWVKDGAVIIVETGTSGEAGYDRRMKRVKPNDPAILESLAKMARGYNLETIIEEV